nr:MAG TPA: hypothetical protein [Caudoviricetes sp.]
MITLLIIFPSCLFVNTSIKLFCISKFNNTYFLFFMRERYYTYNVYPTGKSLYRGIPLKIIYQINCTIKETLKAFSILALSNSYCNRFKTTDITATKTSD